MSLIRKNLERSRAPASAIRAIRRAAIAFALLAAAPLAAQDGSYDPSFSAGGRLWLDVSSMPADEANVLRTLPDGTLFVAGNCKPIAGYDFGQACAIWLDAHGSYSSTYAPGGLGRAYFEDLPGWTATDSRLVDAQPLADGRIAVLCSIENEAHWVLAVLKKDGTGLDAHVGNGGIVTLLDGRAGPVGSKNDLYAMTLQRDGRLVAVGRRKQANDDYDMIALRLTANTFALDPSFGSGGVATVDLSPGDEAHAVAVQPDGRIVLAGTTYAQAAFVRLTAAGALDPTFGPAHDGHYLDAFGSTAAGLSSIALDTQGRIVFGGSVRGPYDENEGLIGRLLPSGTLDPGFQLYGSWTWPLPYIYGVLMQSDGKVLAGGARARLPVSANNYFAVLRFNTDGSFDNSFGGGGLSYGDLSSRSDSVNDVPASFALTNGGLMIAGTTLIMNQQEGFALTKLRIDLIFTNGFER